MNIITDAARRNSQPALFCFADIEFLFDFNIIPPSCFLKAGNRKARSPAFLFLSDGLKTAAVFRDISPSVGGACYLKLNLILSQLNLFIKICAVLNIGDKSIDKSP